VTVAAKKYRVRLALRRDLHFLPLVERVAATRFAGLGLDPVYHGCFMTAEEFEDRQHRGMLWVAAAERDRPIGFATCSLVDGNAHLDEIDVLPQHGQRGVGSLLLGAVCAWAESSRCPAITLSTARNVPWNEPFYRRRGFRELAEAAHTVGLRTLRAAEGAAGFCLRERLIMRRELPSRRVDGAFGRRKLSIAKTTGAVVYGLH